MNKKSKREMLKDIVSLNERIQKAEVVAKTALIYMKDEIPGSINILDGKVTKTSIIARVLKDKLNLSNKKASKVATVLKKVLRKEV